MSENWREIRLNCPDCNLSITAQVRGDTDGLCIEHNEAGGHVLRLPPVARPELRVDEVRWVQ